MTNSLRRGDFVRVSVDGRALDAMIVLASPNGHSLMIMFDGLLDGCAGVMPLIRVIREDGSAFHNVMTGRPVEVVERADPDPVVENITQATARLRYEAATGRDWHNAPTDPGLDPAWRDDRVPRDDE